MCLFSCTKYDDTELRDRVDNLESRVVALEQLQSQMDELKILVQAIQNKDYVTAVTPILEGGVQVGYAIVFSQSGTVEIRNGADGLDGKDGKDGKDGSPGADGKDGKDGSVVSIKQDEDGIFYWTIDGEFTNPKLRVDGATPQFKIDEEAYLCVSYDGVNWERLGKTGATVSSNYKIEYDEDNVYITFLDEEGYKVTLPREKVFSLGIAKSAGIGIKAGGSVSIPYVLNQADETVLIETICENGYKAEVIKTDVNSGNIKVTAPDPFVDGKVLVFANKADKTCMKALHFEAETFTMTTTAYEADQFGGQVEVNLLSNLEFTVEIPEADTWVRLISTKAENFKLVFEVDANEGAARTSTITLRGAAGEELLKITIAQDAYVEEFIEALFGFQPYVEDTRGFTKDANFTMAVVGDYLIVSNAKNIDEMPVYNRMTGEYLPEVKVNTEGIDCKDREFRAICTDDAGHLFAVTYVSTLDEDTANDVVRAFVWKNGIDQKPTPFIYADVKGSMYANAPMGVNNVTAIDLFNTV
ncbi:MAG: PL29 family lyase N-terminal domain-containing protein, partial [Candidatus Cryptobacteroides sp.]